MRVYTRRGPVKEGVMARSWWVAVVLLLAAGDAWPCSGPTCESYFGVVPRPGSTVPANAPALAIQQTHFSESTWDGGVEQVIHAPVYTLARTDGGAIGSRMVSVGTEQWVILDGGLSAGDALVVTADAGGCGSAGVLTVGPAASLPTQSATISLAGRVVLMGTGGFCGGPQGVVQHALLTITPAPELAPWAAMTRWELDIDGQNYTTSAYGAVGATPRTGQPATAGFHPIDTFHVQCVAPADAGAQQDAMLRPGVHQVRLLARIVGFDAPIASNTLSVDMDCVPSNGPPDAGVDDGGDTITPDAGIVDGGDIITPDAGMGAPDAGVAAASDDLGKKAQTGCAAAPGLMLAALVLVLARRRP